MRKLAIACFSYSAAVFAANYLFSISSLPLIALLAIVPAVYFILHPAKYLRGITISLIFIAIGFGSFWLSSQQTVVKAEKLSGEVYQINAKVISYPIVYDDYCRIDIELMSDELPGFKAILYDSSKITENAEPGNIISFEGKLKAAGTKYGEEYDYYYSKGIYFTINNRSDIAIVDRAFDILTLPQRLNRTLTEHISRVFPEDTAPFVKALLLGNKAELYEVPGQYSALRRAGLSHVVSVSGMHIAVLLLAIHTLLGKNRKASIFAIALSWCFVLVSGASPSAVRAGLMQSVLIMAPIFRRENDPITSLGFALALILACNPNASASISLQLSFASMAGIMLYASKFYDALMKFIPRALNALAVSVAASVSSMIFTLPLVAVYFGEVNTLSVVSNALIVWLISIVFCAAFLACGVALISIPLASALAWVISWFIRYILLVAKLVSSLPFATVYLENAANIVWLILTCVFVLALALSKMRIAKKVFLTIAFSATTLLMASFVLKTTVSSKDAVITALDVGQGQCISIVSKDKTVLIDCGSINNLDNAGELAAKYLISRGRKEIDLLVLTHIHSDHANGVVDLMELTNVQKIIMPIEPNDDDGLYDKILEAANQRGTVIEYISEKTNVELGNICLQLWEPQGVGDANEQGLIIQASVEDYDVLVTGDASSSVEKRLVKDGEIEGIDTLIAGHHGSRYSSCGAFLKYLDAENVIISCGYNTFGHPTHETLARYKAYGYNIHRTDLSGNIEIRLG